jgi:DNA-binding PadR family transcriptional regulator
MLGVLNVMPMTGYDLKTQAFDRVINHFWQGVLPQIYRELERMEASGWLTSSIEVQQERPNRRVYTITDAGRVELERWLHTFQPPPPHREAFLIQLFFASQLPNADIIALLEEQLATRRAQRETLQALEGMFDHDHPRAETLAHLTLELGQQLTDTYIDWLEKSIKKVKSLPE